MRKHKKYRNYNIPKEDTISYRQENYERRKKRSETPICDRHIDGA